MLFKFLMLSIVILLLIINYKKKKGKSKKKRKNTWEETVCKDFGIVIPKRVSDLISRKTSNILELLDKMKSISLFILIKKNSR